MITPGAHGRTAAPQAAVLRWGRNQLPPSRAHEARILLEWALRVETLLAAPKEVGAQAQERYRSAIRQRQAGFPLQHITGRQYFRGLELEAGPGVFSARPETEMLVEYALELLPPPAGPALVADLCSGSGAIGLAFASERPAARVLAVELSKSAANSARRNLAKLALAAGSTVEIIEGDALVALPSWEGRLDLVLTNPPYVPGQPPLRGDVLFDPESALYGGGEDGLVMPRGIIRRAAALLRPGGALILEHSESQAETLRAVATENGLEESQTLPDLAGRPRFLLAWQAGKTRVGTGQVPPAPKTLEG